MSAKRISSKKSVAKKTAAKKAAPTRKAAGKTGERKAAGVKWTMRVRMYRQGLGDCFLVTVPKDNGEFFHMVIDCGVLMGTAKPDIEMSKVVDDIALTTDNKLDLLVITHEHWDHLSGFHQAETSWAKISIESVWMGWTENPKDAQARDLTHARNTSLRLLDQASKKLPPGLKEGVQSLLGFSGYPVLSANGKTTGAALDKIRLACKAKGGVRYLDPGIGPLALDGVPNIRVYVLGPPRNEKLLKKSDANKSDKTGGVVFGLASEIRSLAAAVQFEVDELRPEEGFPFGPEYRVDRNALTPAAKWFHDRYNTDPSRAIDDDWMSTFGELAMKLDSDTNNTSLVLAFELEKTGEVALFVGDAQVGNWQSWETVTFDVSDDGQSSKTVTAADLIARTKFYKGGHHLSHNATLKKGGIDLMERDDLVVFAPVDCAMAAKQGRVVNGKPKGWEMPAKALFKALMEKSHGRVVLSDRAVPLSAEALEAGVTQSPSGLYVEYCF